MTIRILVVDDSPFMRKSLQKMLEEAPDLRVVATARDGQDALEKIQEFQPDIVTLDIEMPRMDGLTCLKRIMAEFPRPVLMVSSLTQEGAQATLDALSFGALDFIPKENSFASMSILQIQHDLQEKVRRLAGSPRFRRSPSTPTAPPAPVHLPAPTPHPAPRHAAPLGAGLPTSPQAAILKDGQLLHLMQRSDFLGHSPEEIALTLGKAYERTLA